MFPSTDNNFQQTKFASQEPLLEEPVNNNQPQDQVAASSKTRVFSKWHMIAAGLGLILLIVGFNLLPKSSPTEVADPTELTQENFKQIGSEMEQKLAQLEAMIAASDPTRTTLIAPIVDFKVTVDEL